MNNKNQFNNLDDFLRSQRDVIFKEDDDLYDFTDTSKHMMSPAFENKIRKKIRGETQKRNRRHVWTRFEKAAVFIVAICAVALISAMSVEAIREAVWDVIVEWFGISYSVSYDEENKDPTRVIQEKREPSYLPVNYEKEVIQDTVFSYYVQYSVDNEIVLTYEQASVQGAQMLDGDDCVSSYVYINEHKCFVVEYADGGISFAWSDAEYFYTLNGYDVDLTQGEMIKIAESIK